MFRRQLQKAGAITAVSTKATLKIIENIRLEEKKGEETRVGEKGVTIDS